MGAGGWVDTQTHERVRAHVLDHPLLDSVFNVNPREEQCESTQPTATVLIRQEYTVRKQRSKYKCRVVKVEKWCTHALSRQQQLKASHI